MSDMTGGAVAQDGMLARISGQRDVLFAVGLALVLGMLFVPLPTVLLDFGLAVSLSLSVLILMVALWIRKPLEFSAFPTLLLVVTMLRLALNVSSTRLILSEGHSGEGAAGQVIEGFSRFVVGGDFIIGVVIFAILVVINFVVITKGSTRIAEVSARFSLDAMPGKQMAIDADLGAGTIDEETAKARRKELEDESGFFGAMDGASKFVRGDAVAGIIITLINVVGGILIGVTSHGLSVGQAADHYTTLTIGDGLVTQVPALIVSLAAGMIVTKGGNEGAANEAVLGQLGGSSKALYVAAALLAVMGVMPGFPLLVFWGLAAAMVGMGVMADRSRRAGEAAAAQAAQAPPAASEEAPQDMLPLDDVRLEIGSGIAPMVSAPAAALPGKIKSLRKLFVSDFGFLLNPVRIRSEADIPALSYVIRLHGVEAAQGEVRPTAYLVIDPAGNDIPVPGERVREPTFGLEAAWIDAAHCADAEAAGLTVIDPESVITTHLTEILKENLADLMTYGVAKGLIDTLDKDYQKLAGEISNPAPVVLVQHVLQRLLAERVAIRNLPLIIEAIAEVAPETRNLGAITDHVRQRLSNQICRALTDASGYLPVMVPSTAWQEEIVSSVKVSGDERQFTMSPQRVQEFVLAARGTIQEFSQREEWPALLVPQEARSFVRSMLERVSPQTQVLSYEEIHRKTSLRTVATIGE